MKFSIITPSFNSGDTVETAIESVRAQKIADCEHIVVDGGSTDGTLEILKAHPHVRWVSAPDRGQVHAMNKGFAIATGDIIGYLNADDQYLPGAFSAVLPHFENGETIVMGKVRVRSEKPGGLKEWICDADTGFSHVIRHWRPDAFCVNPVGYFYRSTVQEKVPLREEAGAKHDLAFLMEAALHFSIKKIDTVLGIFNHAQDTQTGKEQLIPSYWQPSQFPFLDRLIAHLPDAKRRQFRLEQERGYQLRRHWTVTEAVERGMAKRLFDDGEVFMLPQETEASMATGCGFVEHDRLGTQGDWVVVIVSMGHPNDQIVHRLLGTLPHEMLPTEVYFLDCWKWADPFHSHFAVGSSLKRIYDCPDKPIQFKILFGFCDPVEGVIADYLRRNTSVAPDSGGAKARLGEFVESTLTFLEKYFESVMGAFLRDESLGGAGRYKIVAATGLDASLYRSDDLPRLFSPMSRALLGIADLPWEREAQMKEKETVWQRPAAGLNRSFRFDPALIETIYSSPLVKAFCTKKEIGMLMKKWTL